MDRRTVRSLSCCAVFYPYIVSTSVENFKEKYQSIFEKLITTYLQSIYFEVIYIWVSTTSFAYTFSAVTMQTYRNLCKNTSSTRIFKINCEKCNTDFVLREKSNVIGSGKIFSNVFLYQYLSIRLRFFHEINCTR